MRIYPELAGPRTKQVLADASVVASLVLFAIFAGLVRMAVLSLRVISEGMTSISDSVHGTWSAAADVFSGIPLVGERIQSMLGGMADTTVGNASDLGRSVSAAITTTANVLAFVTFAVPAALILVFWLPLRIRRAQRWDAAARVLGLTPARAIGYPGEVATVDPDRGTLVLQSAPPAHLLAMRALCMLPLEELVKFEPRPFEAYADGQYGGLVAALYDFEGLRPVV